MLSLLLFLSCLLSKRVLCANNPHNRLGGEGINIKGVHTSFLVDHQKQVPPLADNESPPSISKTPSPPSPLSDPAKPSLLEEKLSMERRFVTSGFEKTSAMVEKEGFDHVKGGRIGTQNMKETGDLVGKGKDGLLASFTYLSSTALMEKIMELTKGVLQFFALSNAYGISVWVCFVVGGVWTGTLPRIPYVARSIGVFLIARCVRSSHFGLHSFRVYMMLLSLCTIALYTFYIRPLIFELFSRKVQLEKWIRKGKREEEVWGRQIRGGMQIAAYHRAKDTSEIRNLERQLIFLAHLSVIGDAVASITLATEIACIVASIGKLII